MVTTRAAVTEWKVVNEEKQYKMAYRYLGNTGMKVSIIGYGNMTADDTVGKAAARDDESQKFACESVKYCFERGINFFDTAEAYGSGASEIQLGVALKALGVPRNDYIVSTKILWCGAGVNDGGQSRKHIIEGTKNSLKRLQLDYVDIIFSHRHDVNTPLEETVRAYSWLIDQGMAHYWGTSEWPASMIEQAFAIAEKYRLHAPVVEQSQYNMLERDRMELELRDTFMHRKIGTTLWGPVCAGLLTGKFNDGNRPEGSRGAQAQGHPILHGRWEKYLGAANVEKTTKTLQALGEIAKEVGVSQSALALGWVLANDDTSTALVGFTKMHYIDDNLTALQLLEKWNADLEKQIEAVLGNAPELPQNFRSWSSGITRRPH